MPVKNKVVAQNPLVLRCHRIMEAFAKSDDERDFYLNRLEGYLVYVDLDKSQDELDELSNELTKNADNYCQIPKLTFYEVKKVMEGFVNEKVYDIDTKEKLLDIIQSKEARENFLEFIYDHHTELEKWQQYYQERFRVRIIEWLRNNEFDFVFEEDLELTKSMVEKLKLNLFVPKVSKDLLAQRKNLIAKAKTYYSSEALNPRPKRGRPPKQIAKVETEPQFSHDVYVSISKAVKPFLFAPEYHGSSAVFTFSGKFASEADLLAHRRQQMTGGVSFDLQNINQKLQALRSLSSGWNLQDDGQKAGVGRQMPLLDGAENAGDEYSVSEQKARARLRGKAKKSPPVKKATLPRFAKPAPKKAILKKTQAMPLKKLAPIVKAKAKVQSKGTSFKKAIPVKKGVAVKKPGTLKKSAPVKKGLGIKKAPAKKAPAQKAPTKKAPAKLRLRPLPKKARLQVLKKEKAKPKNKGAPLRHLRPTKKR